MYVYSFIHVIMVFNIHFIKSLLRRNPWLNPMEYLMSHARGFDWTPRGLESSLLK